ncbi:MazG nucleotide pyrophosphohydrolase domain-containing protein [Streptomyces sp. NPDC002690]
MDQEPDGLDALTERAMRIHALYDRLNLTARGRTWSREEFMLGFVGDVGDLAKIVMAEEGARPHPTAAPGALAHELADCLWSVLVLAHLYDIDLRHAFTRTMAELETAITADLELPPRPEAPA